MVLRRLSSTEALQSGNKNRKWLSAINAGQELLHPITKPFYSGTIGLEQGDTIATFGSCFAMNILRAFPGCLNIIKLFENKLFTQFINAYS